METTVTACRRHQRRYRIPEGVDGSVRFTFPHRSGRDIRMTLRDMSRSGLSFHIDEDLDGLDVGDLLGGLEIRLDRHRIRGELLVMHLTPDSRNGSVCGGLFYPASDGDLLAYRALVGDLESRD